MRIVQGVVLVVVISLLLNCTTQDFKIYSDPQYATLVEQKFKERQELAQNRYEALFGIFNKGLTVNEEQALKFLYAFMPLSDLADYDGDFFLGQVQSSLAARDTFPWGATIPETEFRHFVLPYRINNENLDTARQVFFEELKDRIKGMSMLEAAMEVNHWCHEKVTYKGTDIRTSAPLATVKSAFGRCGEESTFTTAALRAVSIPARQVYTPRWAHSDDNHAWVEFWADGEWHYLGACEPSHIPSHGWFTEPARRAMLIHTKAFGAYQGSELVDTEHPWFSWINSLNTYAQTKELFVQVLDSDKQAVVDANVAFKLFNYAEFYSISNHRTDEYGICSFVTGLGDLLVWANRGDRFAYQKIDVAAQDTLVLVLDQQPYTSKTEAWDLNPPIIREPFTVSNEGKELIGLRLKKEDSIRSAYERTFMSEKEAKDRALEFGVDQENFWNFIYLSRGNYSEITDFVAQLDKEDLKLGLELLEQVSEKDLRDTQTKILMDHLRGAKKYADQFTKDPGIFNSFLLKPRVGTEMLVDYRNKITSRFEKEMIALFEKDPTQVIAWIEDNIKLDEAQNYYETPLSPVGAIELGVADELSAQILMVSMLRSFGHPARIEAGTGQVQYWSKGIWERVSLKGITNQSKRGTLKLVNHQDNPLIPKYHTHFTLAKFEDGAYNTLSFDWDQSIEEFGTGINLDPGYYLLVVGNRQEGGKVLHQQEFFELKEGQILTKVVQLRTQNEEVKVLAKLDLNESYKDLSGQPVTRGFSDRAYQVIAWIDPDKEPTKHTFQDLPLLKKELDESGLAFSFVIPEQLKTESFNPEGYNLLPKDHRFLISADFSDIEELEQQTGSKLIGHLPVICITNQEGEVIYLSSGYKIGIGEELIKSVRNAERNTK